MARKIVRYTFHLPRAVEMEIEVNEHEDSFKIHSVRDRMFQPSVSVRDIEEAMDDRDHDQILALAEEG